MFQNVIRYTRRCISTHSRSGILRIHGPDQKGIVAASSQLLDHHGFSIVQSEQLTDGNDFYQRTVFHSQVMHNQDEEYASNISYNNNDHNDNSSSSRSEMETQLLDLKQRFNLTFVDLDWRSRMMKKKRMAIFVSKYDHCLVRYFPSFHSIALTCVIQNESHLFMPIYVLFSNRSGKYSYDTKQKN